MDVTAIPQRAAGQILQNMLEHKNKTVRFTVTIKMDCKERNKWVL